MSETGIPDLNVFTDSRDRRRITWKGRKGFPVMLRKDESPEDAYLRTIAADAAKAAAPTGAGAAPAATPSPPPTESAVGGGAAGSDRARPAGSDPKPRSKPVSSGKPRATKAQLIETWEELLSLPALPMGMPVHDPVLDTEMIGEHGERVLMPGFRPYCEFCRDHFMTEGPKTAAAFVEMGEQSPPLRRVLEQVHTAWQSLSIAGVLSGYLLKPMLHHLAPEPMLQTMGPVLSIPPRPANAPRRARRSGRGRARFGGRADASSAAAPAAGAPGAAGAGPGSTF